MNRTTEDTINKLRPIDDMFFHKLVEDKRFCEEILQVILQKRDLCVVYAEPQKNLRNINGRSVIVDVLCRDGYNNYYNIEVQKDNNDNHIKRVRYNASNIDTFVSEKGSSFEEIPDVYIVYISTFDMFGYGKTIYHIRSIIEETKDVIDNGYHEIFVNTAVDDGTDIAGLMRILKQSSIPTDNRYPYVCNRIRGFKEGKGIDDMCEVVEEYAKEYAKETVINIALAMIEHGDDDDYINSITKLDYEEIKKLRKE